MCTFLGKVLDQIYSQPLQAYAADLAKDGFLAFTFKISGSKHSFEAQSKPERDGWFAAVEKAIADAKEAKDGVESSEGYKEHKEKISKTLLFNRPIVPTTVD